MTDLQDLLARVKRGDLDQREAAEQLMKQLDGDGADGDEARSRRRGRRDQRGGRVPSRQIHVTGEEYTCEENSAVVSRTSGVVLNKSRFTGNHLAASWIASLAMDGSSLTDSRFSGSRLSNTRIERGHIRALRANGCSVADLTLVESEISTARWNGVKLSGLLLDGSNLRDSGFNGCRIDRWSLRRGSALEGVRLNGVRAVNWSIEDSRIERLNVRGNNIEKLAIVGSTMKNCAFKSDRRVRFDGRDIAELLSSMAGGGEIPRFVDARMPDSLARLRDVTFKDMTLENCTFRDCSFERVRFSGFELRDCDVSGLELEDCEITSADQFRALARAAAPDDASHTPGEASA